jgi:hypothetical protein
MGGLLWLRGHNEKKEGLHVTTQDGNQSEDNP